MSTRPTLLLLPGLTCDAGTWTAQIQSLSDRVDCIVPEWGLIDDLGAMATHALRQSDATQLWVAVRHPSRVLDYQYPCVRIPLRRYRADNE